MRTFSPADDGAAVDMEVGETLAVRLPENASSGHVWAPDEVDPSILSLSPEAADYGTDGVGSGGAVTFRARAVAAGTAELGFKKWRSWEGDSSVVERFRLRITVR